MSKQKPLHNDMIIEAAIKIADENGIKKVSMRSTAAALGVKAMSLYNHVQNKDALLDGMVEEVVAKIELPKSQITWQDFLRSRCQSAYQILQQHAWASQLFLSRMNTGPNMLRYVDATLGALVKAGFSYPQADHAWNAIDNHLYGFVLQEENFPLKPEEYSLAAKAYIPHLEDMGLPNLLAMTNLVAEKRYTGLHEFSFGLDLLITGLETLLHKEMTSSANLPESAQ